MINADKIAKSFGEVLKENREKAGLSQEVLAHAIESHATHISRLENGHKQPTLVTIFKIANQLEIEPEDIVSEVRSRV